MKQSNNFFKRQTISINKLSSLKFKMYLKLLSAIPAIKLVGLSGSLAMLNGEEDHDIDLFIITAKKRLWTGRFIALLIAQLLGIRRKRSHLHQKNSDISDLSGLPMNADVSRILQNSSDSKNKVCINLLFEKSNLSIPKFKRNIYVAHEVLQMKPLVQKGSTYLSFIDANRWVFDIFPNAKKVFSIKYLVSNIKNQKSSGIILNTLYFILYTLTDTIEQMLKNLQLKSINRHKTSEIVTASQLWFHPDDFEKKIKLK